MSQPPNECYFTTLLNGNPQQYLCSPNQSNPSIPSSQNSNSSSQPYAPFPLSSEGHDIKPDPWDASECRVSLSLSVTRHVKTRMEAFAQGRIYVFADLSDDTLYFEDWSNNEKNLMCILKGFEKVSGLKINFNKSKVCGVGVSSSAVAEMARVMKYSMGELPLTYLGLPVGVSMRRESAWRPVVEKLKKREVVVEDIIKVGDGLVRLGIEFSSSFHRKVEDGADRGRWVDGEWKWVWRWTQEPRMRGEGELEELESTLHNIIIESSCRDTWKWSLAENGIFSVRVLSALVDEKNLDNGGDGKTTLLNKIVSKKINVFVWRALCGRLPVRVELDKKGIDIPNNLCPMCDETMRTLLIQRDTIQLENAISTISQEYLLEFTSEYGIPEDLHLELPGSEDTIIDFLEGKVGRRKDIPHRRGLAHKRPKGWDAISWFLFPNGCSSVEYKLYPLPKTTRNLIMPNRTESELLPGGRRSNNSCVITEIDLFGLLRNPNPFKVKTGTQPRAAYEVPLLTATVSRVIGMDDKTVTSGSSGTPSTIEKSPLDFDNENPTPLTTEGSTREGKSLAAMGLEAGSTFTPVAQETSAGAKTIFQGNGYRDPPLICCYHEGGIYQPGWGVTNNCRLDTAKAYQDIVDHTVAMGSQLMLRFEQEVRLLKEARAKIAKQDQRIQTQNLETLLEAEVDMKKVAEVSNLQAQVTGEERIKAAFEEFKKYEDDKVEQQCAEMDARLEALSIDFDEELYPHMLTAITVFTDVVSAGIVNGMSEGLKHGVELGEVKLDLASIKAYNPKADAKFVATLQALKDLKFPLGDSREDAPQWIRELRPSSSQLKIIVYPKVRDPKDPWSIKEEILLEDAIAANISRAKKKKKCRVVCHTHSVGSVYHAKSKGIPVSMPTVASQGLANMLADAAIQTEISEDEASPRLLRSKSLPPMYNLDWP
ncbi:gypsy type transposase [Tanacetum coccineum]|uniref:Gypsy type transposase n=1 Tax=Tanacetum coccineum TaxID=301880 RepID=A0ABQ4XN26_9ASTR